MAGIGNFKLWGWDWRCKAKQDIKGAKIDIKTQIAAVRGASIHARGIRSPSRRSKRWFGGEIFKDELEKRSIEYVLVSGSFSERIAIVQKELDKL